MDDIVFVKTTMHEECDAGAYTHGTRIFLGELFLTYATSEDAANFWDVFGLNTGYVIDPEKTLADNFAFTILYGIDSVEYPSPEIIEAIDALLRGEVAQDEAA